MNNLREVLLLEDEEPQARLIADWFNVIHDTVPNGVGALGDCLNLARCHALGLG